MNIKNFARNKRGQGPNLSEEDLKKRALEFEGKSEQELMRELFQSVEAGKQDGSFSPDALSAFIEQVSPMLSDEQRRNLQTIASRLM